MARRERVAFLTLSGQELDSENHLAFWYLFSRGPCNWDEKSNPEQQCGYWLQLHSLLMRYTSRCKINFVIGCTSPKSEYLDLLSLNSYSNPKNILSFYCQFSRRSGGWDWRWSGMLFNSCISDTNLSRESTCDVQWTKTSRLQLCWTDCLPLRYPLSWYWQGMPLR